MSFRFGTGRYGSETTGDILEYHPPERWRGLVRTPRYITVITYVYMLLPVVFSINAKNPCDERTSYGELERTLYPRVLSIYKELCIKTGFL